MAALFVSRESYHYSTICDLFDVEPKGLKTWPQPRKINLVAGPRQCGKSTLIWNTISGMGPKLVYVNAWRYIEAYYPAKFYVVSLALLGEMIMDKTAVRWITPDEFADSVPKIN